MKWHGFIGNDEAADRLDKLIKEKRMPTALLLLGPQGVGKFLAARMIAAAIFFDSPSQIEQIELHPDLIILRPEGQTIKIEQIREMQREAALAPAQSERRIVIIDDADKMTVQAANSLLKTLEEPEGEAMFILVAANRSLLLPTILSRCFIIAFQPIEKMLLARCLSERYSLPAAQADTLAMLSGGSLGRAAALAEKDALSVRQIAAELLTQLLELRRSGQPVWGISARLAEYDRARLLLLMEALLTFWRDMLVLKSSGLVTLLYNADKAAELQSLQTEISLRELFGAVELTNCAVQSLRANGNVQLLVERFVIKLADL